MGFKLDFRGQLNFNLGKGPFYEDDSDPLDIPTDNPVRLIAYYLPQFHRVPENDEWWGKGFTEWSNATKAVPEFPGHYQPHLPTRFGFYDLINSEIMGEQWETAKRHGISGFCFHHYWFSGRRILHTPLENLLARPDLDVPFCINWANENWTRAWDGSDREVLLEQRYSDAEDVEFIKSIVPLITDRRYIKVDGRPLIMIYQPTLFPDPLATTRRWRAFLESEGLPQPYLVMPQAFGVDDPRPLGFDAVAGFPPHKFAPNLRLDKSKIKPFHDYFSGEVISYSRLAEAASLNIPDGYTLLPGVCPGWDNAARRPNRGLIFTGSTPALYGQWLETACRSVAKFNQPHERLVFINAWNEWAEGAHLEPDRHFGFAYLRETARVLIKLAATPSLGSAEDPYVSTRKQNAGRALKDHRRALVHRVRTKLASFAEQLATRLHP